MTVSTHASLAGRDHGFIDFIGIDKLFLPTRPLRDATACQEDFARVALVSTHASLAGRDRTALLRQTRKGVSTHASLAGRDANNLANPIFAELFLPTRPLRDATRKVLRATMFDEVSTHASLAGRDGHIYMHFECAREVSTHASLAGRDREIFYGGCGPNGFYPRVPCGTRRWTRRPRPAASLFLPTRPLRDATGRYQL